MQVFIFLSEFEIVLSVECGQQFLYLVELVGNGVQIFDF
jgi:hypothetical protein